MWDEAEYERWSASAEDALAAARDNADRGWHNWACMIAEQAAQLAVKAVIHAVGRGAAARGHDLVALLDRVAEETGTAADDVVAGAALRLSRHYQPTRYPDALPGGTPHGRYRLDDAQEAVADSAAVLAYARGVYDALAAAEDDADDPT
ncbi:MAG: HEPN domain-containing protein [Euzebyaceae bacterium]|jgi:HEPN domain-containing protein|nr:HEPN domain-containing protein [Euzebyaceae bacterium]